MLLLVRVKGKDAAIVGYAPGNNGPLAVVVMDGRLDSVPLSDVDLRMKQFPKRLRRALKVRHKSRKLKVVEVNTRLGTHREVSHTP